MGWESKIRFERCSGIIQLVQGPNNLKRSMGSIEYNFWFQLMLPVNFMSIFKQTDRRNHSQQSFSSASGNCPFGKRFLMKTLKTSRQDVFQTPKRCWICKSRRYLAWLSKRHLIQWYIRHAIKTVFRHFSQRVFKTMVKDTLKASLQDVLQTP